MGGRKEEGRGGRGRGKGGTGRYRGGKEGYRAPFLWILDTPLLVSVHQTACCRFTVHNTVT